MSSVFSGALLSFLATPSNVETIKNFKELSEAVKRGTHRAYCVKGTIVVPVLLNSKESYLRQLGRTMEQNNWYLRPEDILNNPMKLLESVIVGSSEYVRFLYGAHSRVLISEENGYSISMAFAIEGNIFKLQSFKYFLSEQTNEEKIEKIGNLSLKDLFSAFCMLLTGWGVSFFIFIGEIVVANYRT
ncbi:lig_chan-Glu_bd domain-containing protein [Trichonephila clavipes]|nr:lig_chan-Glu_bd domain-containing protein [Trichonephila clavipes]